MIGILLLKEETVTVDVGVGSYGTAKKIFLRTSSNPGFKGGPARKSAEGYLNFRSMLTGVLRMFSELF